MKSSRRIIIENIIWRFAERAGAQSVQFVVSIVLARILAPELYGTIALINVYLLVLNIFIDSGLGSALIQKKDADDVDFSSVFFFNIGMCTILYVAMYFAASAIASFYENTELIPVIRVASLTLIISGVKNVQQAYVSRHLLFKRFFYSTLTGTVLAAVVGIGMAYMGYGIWALIAQNLLNTAVDTLVLWITVKWRPKKLFSFDRLKRLWSYGWRILASSLLGTGYRQVWQLVIGKVFSPSDLAYYNRGDSIPNVITSNVNSTINSVLFPAMSKKQDSVEELKSMTRCSMTVSVYIMAPLMMGLAATAPVTIKLLLTDRWAGCVPYLRVFCIIHMFLPIQSANLSAIKALGRSDLFFRLEVIKIAIRTVFLLVSIKYGTLAMAVGLLIGEIFVQFANAWPNRRLLGYGYLEQMQDLIPSILAALTMAGCVMPFEIITLPTIIILLLQIFVGGMVYILISAVFHIEPFRYIKSMIPKMRRR